MILKQKFLSPFFHIFSNMFLDVRVHFADKAVLESKPQSYKLVLFINSADRSLCVKLRACVTAAACEMDM